MIKPATIYKEISSHYDLIPTFCAAAGEPDIVAKCAACYQANGKTYKVHLDGDNLQPFFSGSIPEAPAESSCTGTTTAFWRPSVSEDSSRSRR